jgi:RES domain-containing protein
MIKLRPNPRYAGLRDLLTAKAELFQPWSGTLFRFQTVKFPTPEDMLSGAGAKQRGGRWNPPGVAAVYGSITDTTALEESKANDRYAGIVTRSPRLLVAVEARLDRVLDLSAAWVRRKLGLTLTELGAEDWRKLMDARWESLTQALGRAAFAAGVSGILAQSAACKGGVNVAVFPGNLGRSESLSVVEGSKLRRLAPKSEKD